MEAKQITRRTFVISLGLVPLLAACGSTAAPAQPSTPPASSAPPSSAKPASSAPAASPASSQAAAASGSAAAAPASSAAAGQPVYGGTLRATLGADPTSLDPHKGSSQFNEEVRINMFDALTDKTNEGVGPALAAKWTSPDAKVWTFNLTPGVKFHDGTPLKASMVKYSVERVQNPATGAGQVKGKVAQVASVDAPDDNTVTMTLKTANAAFPLDIADLQIITPNFDEAKPVGTGAFQFVEWVRNQHIQLKKFPDYYRKGLPYLDGVTFQPVPDENQKVVLLQSGQVDFTDTIPLPRVKEVQASGKAVVISIPSGVSPSSYYIPVNTRKAPLNNDKIREALNLAIDRKALLDVTFGYGTIKSNVVPPKNWAHDPSAMEYTTRDVAKAKQLLADGGQPNGFSTTFKYITSRAEYAPMAQLVQANLADIGVKVQLIPMDLGVWVDTVLNKYDYDLGMTGITPANDPSAMMDIYVHTNADGVATGWQNDDYEKQLDQGKAVVAEDQRKPFYFKAQQIVQPAAPGFIINERVILFGATPAVQGFVPDLQGRTPFIKVWLKK